MIYTNLTRKIGKIKDNILTKLYLYKNDSYFNLFFYDIIENLDNVMSNEKFINLDNYDEYQLIFYILIDICGNVNVEKEIYINCINKLFYQLTHNNIDGNIINTQTDNLLLYKGCCSIVMIFYEESIIKRYSMNIDIDVINCNDCSSDEVYFEYLGITIEGRIKPKYIYTMNDVKILAQMCNPLFISEQVDNNKIIIEYCIRIINYQDDSLINSSKMQNNICLIINLMIELLNDNIFTEQSIIFNRQLFSDVLIKLIKHFVFYNEAIFSLIEKIPYKYYKYINKSLLKKILKILKKDKKNIEQNFGYFVKITSVLNA